MLRLLLILTLTACTNPFSKSEKKTPPPPSGLAGSVSLGDSLAPMAKNRPLIKGKLVEAIDRDNFSYLRIQTANGDIWAAVVGKHPAVGGAVQLEEQAIMTNFESKSLGRTFSKITFGVLK